MKKQMKTLAATTLALTITLGGGLVATHYANAATTAAAEPTSQTQADSPVQNGKPFGGKRGAGDFGRSLHGVGSSEELATLLGMTQDELHEALKSGKTIAAIAGEKNVSVQSVVDLIVRTETARLDQLLADGKLTQEQYDARKAELADRATKRVNGELAGKGGFPGGDRGGNGGRHGSSEELATLLGMTQDELHEALQSGKTLAAIAGEKNVAVQSVVDLIVQTETAQLDQLLADGKLTQEQYDARKAELADRATKRVNGELAGKGGFPGGDRGGKGKGGPRGTDTNADGTNATAAAEA
ncbi:SHOCT domain-containing protein [Paenibacillus flagellatus]|nr:SHOCT domain-containing protein [Paenibacillus flagellatus]